MHVYVIMKGSEVFDVAETLDEAMDLVEEERKRVEGALYAEHVWMPDRAPHKGEGSRPYWEAIVYDVKSAGYDIMRWPVRGTL